MSELPAPYDITIYRGDDWAEVFEVLDENDDPVNLSQTTIEAQLRKSSEDDTITATFVVEKNYENDTSKFRLHLPHIVTELFDFGRVGKEVFDVQFTTQNIRTTYLAGSAPLTQDVTK